MNTKRIALLATSAAALALAACSGGKESDQPNSEANVTNMTPIEVDNNTTEVSTEAPAAPRVDNTAGEAAPAPATLATDASTQDDADATGMTARVSRDEGSNEAQPAK